MDFNILGGLNTNFLIGQNLLVNDDGYKQDLPNNTSLDPVSYSSTFGLGMEYGILNNLNFSIEPVIKYYLTPERLPSYVGDKEYTLGIYTGLYYSF